MKKLYTGVWVWGVQANFDSISVPKV